MFSLNDKISIRQLQILIILDIFGTGLIILPKRAAQIAFQDGWIVVVIATLVALLYAYIITTLADMFPGKNFLQLSSHILGRPLGYLLSILYIVKIVIFIAFEIRLFGEIIKETMLSTTPFWIIAVSLICISGYAASKGYEVRARLAEILIFVLAIPLIFVFSIAAVKVDYTNILPIFKTDALTLVKGGYFLAFSFTGLELCLLAIPYVNNSKKIKKSIMHSIFFLGIIYTIITIITTCKFGPYDVKEQMWPVLEMMDTLDMPGSFIERQEAFIMSFWIISTFALVNEGIFFSSVLLKDIIKKGSHTIYVIFCLPIIFFVAYLPKNVFEVYKLLDITNMTLGIAYLFVIPATLLIIATIKKKFSLGKTSIN